MATVLLVEDDPAARHGLDLALRRLGYEGHAAEIGETALRDFRDVAADDVMLPGLDGFEAEPRVLDARIRAVTRRTARADSPAETYGELMIDRGSLIVRRADRDVSLTPTEPRLSLVLSGSPRQVFSREQLLDLVWEHDYLGDSRLVDACVQRLRAKIETDTSEPRYIQTVRGFGHRFGPV